MTQFLDKNKKWDTGYQKGKNQPQSKPTEIPTQIIHRKTSDLDIDSLEQKINIDFEENAPHQEGVISGIYQRPDKSYF